MSAASESVTTQSVKARMEPRLPMMSRALTVTSPRLPMTMTRPLVTRSFMSAERFMLANVNLSADMKLLVTNRRLIVIGNRGEVTVNARDIMGKRGSIRAFTLWVVTDSEAADIFAGLNAGLENGTLRPVVGKELPLKDAARAHIDVMAPGSHGKIALIA